MKMKKKHMEHTKKKKQSSRHKYSRAEKLKGKKKTQKYLTNSKWITRRTHTHILSMEAEKNPLNLLLLPKYLRSLSRYYYFVRNNFTFFH